MLGKMTQLVQDLLRRVDVVAGINKIEIQADTPLAVLTDFDIEVQFNKSVVLKGDTAGNPYLKTDRSPILETRLFTDNVNITDQLEAKTGNDRLDSSAIKNLPEDVTDEHIRDVIAATLTAGSGITLVEDDTNDTLTISSTTTTFNAPRITNFSINVPSRVDTNTDLNSAFDITFDVMHFGSIATFVLDVATGDKQNVSSSNSR